MQLRELTSVDLLISAQSHLLFQQSLWLSGEWAVTVELQFYRNILITLCRLLLSREGTLMHTHTSTEDANDAWLQWIQAEAKRRIVHFTYSKSYLISFPWDLSLHNESPSVYTRHFLCFHLCSRLLNCRYRYPPLIRTGHPITSSGTFFQHRSLHLRFVPYSHVLVLAM